MSTIALESMILISMLLVVARTFLGAARSHLRIVVWARPSVVGGDARVVVTPSAGAASTVSGVVVDVAFGTERGVVAGAMGRAA